MNKKLKISFQLSQTDTGQPAWKICPVSMVVLETGETLKRGCGRTGLVQFEAGLKCFYCGRYLYEKRSSLGALWFHFRLAREYWRVRCTLGRDFINGFPVPGPGDTLPRRLVKDLSDPRPPKWFEVFVRSDEEEFDRYLNQSVMC